LPEPAIDPALRVALGRLARAELVAAVGGGRAPAPPREPARLHRPGASFVSLHDGAGALRGCIGSLEPRRPLGFDVAANTRAAALEDPRFAPVEPRELAGLALEIALLSPLAPLAARDRDELVAALRPGEDGLLLAEGPWRATFLPAVWEQLAEPERFVAQLERKAGLAVGGWSPARRAWRYEVVSFTAPAVALSE
jgi:AmmeMemoRadiSam system protein A